MHIVKIKDEEKRPWTTTTRKKLIYINCNVKESMYVSRENESNTKLYMLIKSNITSRKKYDFVVVVWNERE